MAEDSTNASRHDLAGEDPSELTSGDGAIANGPDGDSPPETSPQGGHREAFESAETSTQVSSDDTQETRQRKSAVISVDLEKSTNGLSRVTTIPVLRRPQRQDSTVTSTFTSHRLHKFQLYETNVRYFITGADVTDKYFKVLKIDRTVAPGSLSLFEDDIVYSKAEITQLLTAIDDGNKATGGLRHKFSFWGVLGFIRFTEAYYMLIITKRQQAAMLGGHYIYQIEGTELVPLTTGPSTKFASSRGPEEGRFLGILGNLDLTKNFYFSYTYNISRTLQDNIIRERLAAAQGQHKSLRDQNDMFVWNQHLLNPALKILDNLYDWCMPITHGFIDQANINVFGRMIYITIVGRRSRFFAGARFLKRGINDLGYVANDVETEQIVSEMLTTSFHAPGPRLFSNPNYTSYVHHRGSIPLHWTQDNTGVSPKPDINLSMTDPFFQPAALHFDHLFKRYGSPIYVLNLIKARERTPRESKLLQEFKGGIDYLNQFLPEGKKVQYKAFDMSRASKTRGGDVIGTLERIADEILKKTDFFANADTINELPHVQNGVARTNCIDCLDRTNAAQFVIGKHAFGRQLQALGVIPSSTMEYDSDAIDIFTHMFHDHGDTIAVQYGGSHLVNTMATYRKMNHWQGHGRDMVESFKRYYHNSFLDSQRQEAYNLFLGNYIYVQGQPMLWDLSTDYYLHHSSPRHYLDRTRSRKSYQDWYDPEHLALRVLPLPPALSSIPSKTFGLTDYDDYWLEYYRPLLLSSFQKVYAYRLSTSTRFLENRPGAKDRLDPSATANPSPFIPRLDPNRISAPPDSPDKRNRKGVTIIDPNSEPDEKRAARENAAPHSPRLSTLPPGSSILIHPATPLTPNLGGSRMLESITTAGLSTSPDTRTRPPPYPAFPSKSPTTAASSAARTGEAGSGFDKSAMAQWTLNRIYENSLNPSVSVKEANEYERYVSHPSNIPLVVSEDVEESEVAVECGDYVASGQVAGLGWEWFEEERPGSQGRIGGAVGAFGMEYGSREGLRRSSGMSKGSGRGGSRGNGEKGPWDVTEEDVEQFREFVEMGRREDVLAVGEMDREKKRYKAYRQWLVKGKSLFKQSKVDPEYRL